MISSYASGTELATIFCIVGWIILTFKNFKRRLFAFGIASTLTVLAYSVAFVQYFFIFFIDHSMQSNTAMNLLFIRMLLHCTTVLVFIYNFDAIPSLRMFKK